MSSRSPTLRQLARGAWPLAGAALTLACGGGDTGDSGAYHHYVSHELKLPTDSAQRTEYALDIDGDPQGMPDNQLGLALTLLAEQGIDLQTAADVYLARGEIVVLHSLRADDLTSDGRANWQVYVGETQANPDFSGAGMFTVSSASPLNARVSGKITNGRFEGGPATIPLSLPFVDSAPPVQVDLFGARLQAKVTATGCTEGKVGGALSKEQIDTRIIPAAADALNELVANTAGCPAACPAGSAAQGVLDFFDVDDSGTVSDAEIRDNAAVSLILAPDLDLFDASGDFNPRSDGVKDAVSLGLGFGCVGATFTAPGEEPAQ